MLKCPYFVQQECVLVSSPFLLPVIAGVKRGSDWLRETICVYGVVQHLLPSGMVAVEGTQSSAVLWI